ncbi:M67 family metallopeptidase [Alicyclobacillus suci]|uniref:M67 family metallopeptidase n=1 Tax=Alicyclobacillus suci TaxID=2816080 RepID=UPI001A8F9E6E
MSAKIVIHAFIHDELKIQARKTYPYECCGILGGTNGLINTVYWINNIHYNPYINFLMEPYELLSALKEFSKKQLVWRGVVHSHPLSAAIPSQEDLEFIPNLSPGMTYLIYSLSERVTNGYLTTNTSLQPVKVTYLR